jgi:PAS domain S-box-containing protein|tara:strand:+ start:2127 stop:4121 length:1995 start_codon:yes stop_codon:yes gene_type:complete
MYSLDSSESKKSWRVKLATMILSDLPKKTQQPFGEFNYEWIVHNLAQLVYVKDTVGKYCMVNQAFCDLTGYTMDQILGKNDLDLGLFLNSEQIMIADKEVVNSAQKKYIPLEPFTDRSGSLYWFKTSKTPIKDELGNVSQILIVSSDITKRIEVEQRLYASELRYKSIFENNYSGIILVNEHLDILYKNLAFNKLLNSAETALAKDDLKKYISEEDQYDLIDLMAGLVSRNYEYFDLALNMKVGSDEVVNTVCFVRGLYDDDSVFTEAVVTFQNISDDLRIRLALEESEKRFKVIVESAVEALMLLDYDAQKYIDVNKSAVELFGYSRKELLSLKLGELSPLLQSDGDYSTNAATDLMEKCISGENVVYEWTVKRKDNKLIPCEVRLVKLPFEGNRIVRVSAIDISERKRSERMLNLDKQKLEDKNEELISLNQALENQTNQLQEFAYISSHNLRSPAGNIRALLDFYHNDPNEENFKIVLEKLDVVSEDLLDTINDLADVVKIKNEISQDFRAINLAKLIEKANVSLSQEILDKKATIEVQLNGISFIKASKTYMDSIILNLLSNALKYSQKKVPPRIHISAAHDETCLILKVEDNGLGIDMELYGSKLFGLRKTFHKNKDSRGVGLFITKAQVEAMQGTIYADSEPGKGATFYIRLPKKMIV